MRDLEVCLTGRDIWHVLSKAGERENGLKNSTIQIILLFCAAFSFIYTHFGMTFAVSGTWRFGQFFDYFIIASGVICGYVLIITYIKRIFQWFKMTRSPMMERYHIRFGENQIEQWFDNGKREVYSYSYLLRIQKTKRMLFLFVNRKENTSALLLLPSSAFADDREMELCAAFLKDMQKGSYIPEYNQEQDDQDAGALFTFTAIYEEDRWIDQMVRGKHFVSRTKYGLKLSHFIFILPVMAIFSVMQYRIVSDISPFLGTVMIAVIFVSGLCPIIWKHYSYAGIRSQVKRLATVRGQSKGWIRQRRICLDQYGIRVTSDCEHWVLPYQMVFDVIVGAKDVFVFLGMVLFSEFLTVRSEWKWNYIGCWNFLKVKK